VLLVMACLPPSFARAARSEHPLHAESEPALVLPGTHAVRAGQWIDLRWTCADSISEMEILLSSDGGLHYDVWASPRISPASRHFRWRVPSHLGGDLRLRLRYNRGGREIEAAPVLCVRLRGDSDAEPLALPPLEGSSAPRPAGGRGESPGARAELSGFENDLEPLATQPAAAQPARAAQPSYGRRACDPAVPP
jgi:hypothetical protein